MTERGPHGLARREAGDLVWTNENLLETYMTSVIKGSVLC